MNMIRHHLTPSPRISDDQSKIAREASINTAVGRVETRMIVQVSTLHRRSDMTLLGTMDQNGAAWNRYFSIIPLSQQA